MILLVLCIISWYVDDDDDNILDCSSDIRKDLEEYFRDDNYCVPDQHSNSDREELFSISSRSEPDYIPDCSEVDTGENEITEQENNDNCVDPLENNNVDPVDPAFPVLQLRDVPR